MSGYRCIRRSLTWGLCFSAVNLAYGPSIGLRALAAAPRTLRAAVVTSVMGFVGAVTGAKLGGLEGTAMGFLVTQVFGIGVWWWEFRGGMRDYVRGGDAATDRVGGAQLASTGAVPWIDPSGPDHL